MKPGALFRDYGNTIEKVAKQYKCQVVKTYCGHGINQLFHTVCSPQACLSTLSNILANRLKVPNVPHYAKNKAVGEAKPGMCFTIEPMITLGSHRDKTWPDDWTSVTVDGKRTAQFEHTLLVTETGVEILTARQADSPGGAVELIPETNGTNGDAKTA